MKRNHLWAWIAASILILTVDAWCQAPPSTLRVATRIVPPFVIDEKSGFSIDLWNAIAREMHVQSILVVKNSVLDLLSEVQSGNADVGIAAISITSERDKLFDFSQPMFNAGLQIMVAGRGGDSGANPFRGLMALLLSPAMLVWLGIVAVLIIAPAHIVWLLERHHPEGIIPSKAYFSGIFHGMWWAASTLATQADSMPRSSLARVLAILWMFTSVVFVAYFTAQVTASLTVQQLHGSIRGPDDLPGKRIATTTGSTSAGYLREAKCDVVEFPRIEEAYTALHDNKVDAIVFDAPVLLYYASHEGKGSAQVVGSIFRKEDYGIAFPSGSPYRRRADLALLKLKENGTYQKLYDKWFGSE